MPAGIPIILRMSRQSSKKYIFILLLIFFLSLIILNTSVTTVYATIYRIIDTEGNTIRVTTEPQMKKSEEDSWFNWKEEPSKGIQISC